MNRLKICALGGFLLLWLCVCSLARADEPRQYYSSFWTKSPAGKSYYRNYFFRPSEEADEYAFHRVIYYPKEPRYLYFYNPVMKTYWGRFDCVKGKYSTLDPEDRRGRLEEIPEEAFPPPGPMPAIPGSTNGVRMQAPSTDDLPPDKSITALKDGSKDAPRQFYSGWCKRGGYYYCFYFYRPTPDADYESQRCVYYPSRPAFIYFYDPHRGVYWGRYDLDTKGYSTLADEDRSDLLANVPETAFPPAGQMPAIPESEDGTLMEPPSLKPPVDSSVP